MKKWALVVLALYGSIIIIFTFPVTILSFLSFGPENNINLQAFKELFTHWPYWAGFALFLAAQAALLDVHVDLAGRRPVAQRRIMPVVVFSSLLMALLVAGIVLAVNETLTQGKDMKEWLALVALGASWVVWGCIFYIWSRKLAPQSFLERIRLSFFRGSILELLVAVPLHILARYRNYCCAGFGTFLGIAFGLAVMVCSFGPGVFFLFVERWKKLHPQEKKES
jgi:hypothetical protein